MNREYNMVKKFHTKFNQPVANTPTPLNKYRARLRYEWMMEEINEFLDATEKEDIVEQTDALIDTIYFALGALVEMGIMPDEPFQIVQDANMSKLWEDGTPHYNAEGKVIKPPTWQDPHTKLKDAIERRIIRCQMENLKK